MQIPKRDTIAAILTSTGEGGIGVIRLSGVSALKIATNIFRGKDGSDNKLKSWRVRYGWLSDHQGEVVDEALFTFMKSPRSYTCEDVVEISLHGGAAVVKKALELVLSHGARLAEPGEFTKRAYLNGRIDLLQAESVIDIIRSSSDKGLKIFALVLDGVLSEKLQLLEESLVHSISQLEVSLDFPDDDLDLTHSDIIAADISSVIEQCSYLIGTYSSGRIYRDGFSVAIGGAPNVGKSSLMNALLGRERMIVTSRPGTTRDSVEEFLHLSGVATTISDSAGIRETEDEAEQLGVERSFKCLADADLAMLVFDNFLPITDLDIQFLNRVIEEKGADRVIIILNKSDLPVKFELPASAYNDVTTMKISALTHLGIDELKSAISAKIDSCSTHDPEGLHLTRERHVAEIKLMIDSLEEALVSLKNNMSPEFVLADLAQAQEALGRLTGRVVSEQVIDHIFNEFCIGK